MLNNYDLIILGSGPAGLTSAIYAKRAGLSVAIIERGIPGGQMNNTMEIENYPGVGIVLGPDLSNKMYSDMQEVGDIEEIYEEVINLKKENGLFKIITNGNIYTSKTVIIGTGSNPKKLDIEGETKYNGRGVSYCAICDGAFFKDKNVIVIGGGDSAIEEALYLSDIVKNVTIIHRRESLRAKDYLQKKAFKKANISFLWNTIPISIKGDNKEVTSLEVKNVKENKEFSIQTDGVFIYVGMDPNNFFVSKELNILEDNGFVITNELMETMVGGLYAIGDIRDKKLRQITTAVGDGAIAAQEAYNFIKMK
jgi:thioredoxin reductase (NADPH)